MIIIILILIGIIKLGGYINKKELNKKNQYEKQKEILNKSFSKNDYVLPTNQLLIEIKNNSNIIANADIRIKFYNKNKKQIKIKDTSIIGIEKKHTNYVSISLKNISYHTYKVSYVLSPNTDSTKKILTKKIKILSSKKQNHNIQVEYKNTSSQDLDNVEIGVLFYNNKNKIIAYQSVIDTDLKASTSNFIKVNIPYDNKYNPIKYAKSKTIVLNAYHTKEE